MKKCTLALGCFWKPEENFKNKPGIIETEVGYAGGLSDKVTYEEVSKDLLNPKEERVNYIAPPNGLVLWNVKY